MDAAAFASTFHCASHDEEKGRHAGDGFLIAEKRALHDLSDALPSQVHLTLPVTWRNRRLRVPSGLVLHFADVADQDRASFGAVPLTAPLRTLTDCIEADVAPSLVGQALLQARRRGLITGADETRLHDQLDAKAKAARQ